MVGRARKSLLITAGVFGALPALILCGLAFAVMTTAGARVSLSLLEKLVPGELAFGGVGGSIAEGLVLADVRYASPELAATLARVEIDAVLGALLEGRAVFSRIAVENGAVTLHDSDSAATEPAVDPPALPQLPEWLAIRSLSISNVTLTAAAGVEIEELEASVAGTRIELATLAALAAGGQIQASGHALLGTDATARVEGSWQLPAGTTEDAVSGGLRVELRADVALEPNASPWRTTLRWDRLDVQAAETQWASSNGSLTLTPGAMPIEATLTADLTGSALPTAATLSGVAAWTGDTLELEELAIDLLGGRISIRGAATLNPVAGHAVVDYSMLDPSFLDPRLEGDLHGTAVAAFNLEPEIVVGADGVLGGTLGGRPLDGALRANVQNGIAHIDGARVTLERSVIELAGEVSEGAVDLTFEAEVPQVANWYPPATGSVRATGSLSGQAGDPTLKAAVAADDLALEERPTVEELSLDVAGTLSSHVARLATRTPYGALTVRVEQGWNSGQLSGTVLESELALPRVGNWQLTAPGEYAVAGAKSELEQLCYSGPEQAHVCIGVANETLRVDAAELPSSLAEPWLNGLRLQGAANLDLTVGWRPDLHGSFALTQPTLRLEQTDAATAGEPAPSDLASIDDLRITGRLTARALDARLTASLAATGDPLEARVALAPPTTEGMLDATLSARLTSLELVDALVADVEEVTGSLSVNLHATGSPAEPELAGEVVLRSLNAFVPQLGIEITDGRLSARPVGLRELEIDAAFCSQGCIELDGSLALGANTAPWHATAELTGHSFELSDRADLRAIIAPQLVLDATPATWRVTGELAVEEGLLAVETLPRSAVRPVDETVVHGRAAPAEAESLPVPLVADVDIRLGDVRFEGLGIAADLGGVLDIERTSEGQLLVNGTASIEDGTFSAYSQELRIERGDLLFTGPPDNPALDVRTTREVEGATVGLAVTGTLLDPQSEVFSMPALSESEALARLVTGRSLESAGTADAEAIERAAVGLGIRRALPALERIGNNLGLDELGVSSGSGEDSALVAGRQLGEDVYLRYKHGLFDDFAGLELIYRITERFRLRTETGTSQSIDILYERNRNEDAPLAETESDFDDAEPRAGPVSAGGVAEPP